MSKSLSQKSDPDTARAVISELGGTKSFMDLTGYSESRVSQFRTTGFSLYFEKYLRLQYPWLKAWKTAPHL